MVCFFLPFTLHLYNNKIHLKINMQSKYFCFDLNIMHCVYTGGGESLKWCFVSMDTIDEDTILDILIIAKYDNLLSKTVDWMMFIPSDIISSWERRTQFKYAQTHCTLYMRSLFTKFSIPTWIYFQFNFLQKIWKVNSMLDLCILTRLKWNVINF